MAVISYCSRILLFTAVINCITFNPAFNHYFPPEEWGPPRFRPFALASISLITALMGPPMHKAERLNLFRQENHRKQGNVLRTCWGCKHQLQHQYLLRFSDWKRVQSENLCKHTSFEGLQMLWSRTGLQGLLPAASAPWIPESWSSLQRPSHRRRSVPSSPMPWQRSHSKLKSLWVSWD